MSLSSARELTAKTLHKPGTNASMIIISTRLMQSIVGEREQASYCNEFIYLNSHSYFLYVLVNMYTP